MLRYTFTPPRHLLQSAETEAQSGTQAKHSAQIGASGLYSNAQPSEGTSCQSDKWRKPRLVYRQATVATTLLFLSLFSGPPRFRIRDGEASLRGDMDWVVILHILVWGVAGGWVLFQIAKPGRVRLLLKRLSLPQKLGLAMILCLAVSAVVSKAPALSVFKIYQMAVSLLFMQLFVEQFGRASCLKKIFWGTTILCGAIVVCSFLAPNLVWFASDFNPDPSRLLGSLITPTGPVSVFAIILLLTGVRKIWRVLPLVLLGLFFALLVFSLTRTAYAVIFAFFVLVLIKRPNARSLKQFAYVSGALAVVLYAYHWLPNLSEYRQSETISSLDDRIGLWRYLSNTTLTQSPWLGFGYYSASRIYGPQYNPALGNAHSMFFEILLGGGVFSVALFTALCATLCMHAVYLLYKNRDRFSFAVATLFFTTFIFGSMGDEIDSGPVAMCFWYSAAVLPWMYERASKRPACPDEPRERLSMKAAALNGEVP
jgi:O-antigen ligase